MVGEKGYDVASKYLCSALLVRLAGESREVITAKCFQLQ